MDEPDEDNDNKDRTFKLRWLFASIGFLALAAVLYPWGDPKCCMGCSNPPKQVIQKKYSIPEYSDYVVHTFHICGECGFVPPKNAPTKIGSDASGNLIDIPYLLPAHHYGRTPLTTFRSFISALLMLAGSWGGFMFFFLVAFDSKKRKAKRKALQEHYFARLESSQTLGDDPE